MLFPSDRSLMECLYRHMGKALLGHHCGALEGILFYKYIYLILNYVDMAGVGGSVCMSVGTEASRQQPLEMGGYNLPYLGAGNQTLSLWKSSNCF